MVHFTDRKCRQCNRIEDEYHCLAKCPRFQQIRQKYLGKEQIETYSEFIDIMRDQKTETTKKVAWFLLLMNKAIIDEEDAE